MDQAKVDFVSKKRIAVFGVSRSEHKFGNATYKELKARGYDVVAIHPEMESIEGDPVYRSLDTVSPPVEAVFINVSPDKVAPILEETARNQIKHVWLQQGSGSDESYALGEQLGFTLVKGGCILMYAEPVNGIHAFHRWIWKAIKQY